MNDMNSKTNNLEENTESKFIVKDTEGTLILGAGIVVSGLITVYCLSIFAWVATLLFGTITAVLYMMIKAQNLGYIIDLESDTFSYPGGKLAEELSDYIDKTWWLQRLGLKRGEIKLSEISQIEIKDTKQEFYNNSTKMWQTNNTYAINFTGSFGFITQTFTSSGKRDQLYSLLAQKLNMGQPIVVR